MEQIRKRFAQTSPSPRPKRPREGGRGFDRAIFLGLIHSIGTSRDIKNLPSGANQLHRFASAFGAKRALASSFNKSASDPERTFYSDLHPHVVAKEQDLVPSDSSFERARLSWERCPGNTYAM